MWLVRGIADDGVSADVNYRTINDPASRDQIHSAAREMLHNTPAEGLLAAIEKDLVAQDILPGIDGLETWAEAAVSLNQWIISSDELRFEQIGEFSTGQPVMALQRWWPAGRIAITYEQPETIVVDASGLRQVEIVDEDYVTTMEDSGLLSAPPSLVGAHTLFLWRLYAGSGTIIAEGETEFDSSRQGRRPTAIVRLAGKIAFLVGRVARLLARSDLPETHDVSYQRRLHHFESRFPEISSKYEDLRFAKGSIHRPALVFIHGTLASTVPSLALLDPLEIPTFRFEHDTFQSISDNAEELVRHVTRTLKPTKLYLVAHSRGGLVARLAARALSDDCRVIVRTYGTPHLGTPLANAGAKMLSGLFAMGRVSAGGAFTWDPASLAVKRLLRPRELPSGLSVMRTDSETLKSMRHGKEPFELHSYGADYDFHTLADGNCAYTFSEFARAAFGPIKHDLVVPLDSAIAAGRAIVLPGSCDHFSYFSRPDVQQDLRALPH